MGQATPQLLLHVHNGTLIYPTALSDPHDTTLLVTSCTLVGYSWFTIADDWMRPSADPVQSCFSQKREGGVMSMGQSILTTQIL